VLRKYYSKLIEQIPENNDILNNLININDHLNAALPIVRSREALGKNKSRSALFARRPQGF
jgi:hypothetical protein